MLQNRWAMRPLLQLLKENGISYCWCFPFALNATYAGKQYYLKMPDELQIFCEQLHLPHIELPDWYKELCLPLLNQS